MTSEPFDGGQRAVLGLPSAASGAVLGAPGSGKTATIVERVVRLVDGGSLAPESVLVLTPTRVAATRLRDRLGVRVSAATPGPLARSVGSFAFHVVRAAAAARGEEAPQLLTGADQDRILAQLIEGDIDDARIDWPESLSPTVRRSREFRSELRAFVATAIEIGAGRDELASLGDPAWAAVAELAADYADALAGMRSAHRDSAELEHEAAQLLADGDPIPGIDHLETVLIDDAQELTRGGARIVEALRRRGVAVLAFGDPDIASGAFRGVTPQIFADLAAALGDVLVLGEQHRADDRVAWIARQVTQAIGAGGSVAHRRAPGPQPDMGDAVEIVRATSSFDEIDRIAWRLRDWHLRLGIPWGEMAVIAHDTRQLRTLEDELAGREVPTRSAVSARPLGSEPAVRHIVQIVRTALTPADQRDDDAVVEGLRSPFGGFDGVALRRLRGALRHDELAAGGSRPARELLREALANPARLAAIDTAEGRSARRYAEILRDVGQAARAGATIHELLWHVWDTARTIDGRRLAESWRRAATGSGPAAAEAARALDGLVALFDAAKRAIERDPDEGPAPFVREILDSDVPEDTLSAPDRGAAVVLLTPASALGTEFEAVVVAGLQEGVWPNTRPRGGMLGTWRLAAAVEAARRGADAPGDGDVLDRRREALHDELRLFVRAVSRARSRLVVTCVDDEASAPSPLLRLLPPPTVIDEAREHPMTLRGLVAHHRRTLTTSHDDSELAEAAAQLRLLADEGVQGASPGEWYGVRAPSTTAPLRDLELEPVRVSPSAIGGFEECGLEWAIRALGGDTVTSPSAGLGTLLHAALEAAPSGGVDALRAVVDARWGELDFEAAWVARRERRRVDEYIVRLDAYLASVRADGGRAIAAEAEFRFAVELETADVSHDVSSAGRAVVAGVIDRVEAYPRGSGDHASARGKGYEPMRSVGPDAGEATVVMDLKSGRHEERVTDQRVADDAQLASYQIAISEGLVDGAAPEALAGARLVVVSQTTARSPFRVAHQHVLDGDDRRAFLARVVDAARGMSAASFTAAVDQHCTGGQWAPICRIHTIGAVSA